MDSLISQMERLDLRVEPPPPKELTRPQLENIVNVLYNENRILKIYIKYLREKKSIIKSKNVPRWVY